MNNHVEHALGSGIIWRALSLDARKIDAWSNACPHLPEEDPERLRDHVVYGHQQRIPAIPGEDDI